MAEDRYFEAPALLREWLAANHDSAPELWIGFYKKASGRPSLSYHEALDEALCFGWIDGVRYTVDSERYRQRFTRRRKGSVWSAVNVKRMTELISVGRATAPGIAAFEARDPDMTQRYSFENRDQTLSPEYRKRFEAKQQAWAYFEKQPPWYRRTAAFWVMSAKQESTRERRLQQLIDDSEAGLWVGPVRRAQK
jgi:uncharacterized protein YdeI (YjbR/CyaY-like superfamily)